VLAADGALVSNPSPGVSGKTLSSANEPVGEPYNLVASRIDNNRITLEWLDNANNETAFRIYRSTGSASLGTELQVPANAVSYTDTGLAAGTNYYYRVQAVNGAVTGDLSAQVIARTLSSATFPTPPSNLVASVSGSNAVSLAWKDNSTNEDEFIIERSTSPAAVWTELGRVSFNVKSFVDPTVAPDSGYSYRIKASNAAGSSTSSSTTIRTPKLGGEFTGLSARSGDVYHFAFSSPNRIERYDLAARTWLAAIPLNAAATALWADESGIFVAEDRSVVRFNPDGGARTALANGETTVKGLFTIGDVLTFQTGSRYTTLRKTTGTLFATFSYGYDGTGFNVSPTSPRVFFRSSGVSPSDIHVMEIGADGKLVKGRESAYHGDYPSATRAFVFPNGSRVADDSGTVYSAEDLTYSNSLGGALTDLDFHGIDVPIVLRGDKLFSYSNTLLEAGSFTLGSAGLRLAVSGTDALVFFADGGNPHGLRVQSVPLAQLAAPEPGTPVDPNGLAFTPDEVFPDKDGNILIVSKSHSCLFRWSPSQLAYLPTFPLLGIPGHAAYSRENHSVYFAYPSQVVRKMDLSANTPVESPLFTMSAVPRGLATAGEFIFADDESGAWDSHYVFSPEGQRLQAVEWNYYSRTWEWDPVKRRMYFFRDNTSPNDLHYETIDSTGKITGKGETPYHGEFAATPPIRVSPDGTRVVIGSGVVFNSDGLGKSANLANGFNDAVWSGGKLVTLRLINGLSQLQVWEGDLFLPGEPIRQFSGTPVRLFNLDSKRLLLITLADGVPRFSILNENLEPTYISPSKPLPPAALAVTGRTTTSVTLGWRDESDNETGFRIEYRTAQGEWMPADTTVANATHATVAGLAPATAHEFRVSAVAGNLSSTPSPVVSALTLSTPDQPAGEPYNLRITRIFRNSVTLEWQDNGENETGFRIQRSTTADGEITTFTAPAGATTFTSTGLAANTTYYFRIQIENGGILGDLSAQASARTLASDSAPWLSSLLAVSGITPNSVSLKWTDSSTNEDGFRIERSTNPATVWTPLGSVPFNTGTFTDSTAVPDTQYTYRVAAFNSTGSSGYLSTTATTPALGGKFTGLAMRAGGIHYFAFGGPDRIERYDLVSRAWMPAIPLKAAATALWVDEFGIFVAENRTVVRFSLAGLDRTSMGNAQATVKSIFTLKNILAFAPDGGTFVTLNKTTGMFLSNFSYGYSGGGFSVVPGLNRVFFRSTSVSPSDIHHLEFDASGKFISGNQSPYHGAYPSATRTFVFPNGARVADDSGTVYSTDSLAYSNSLAGPFTDLDFHGTDIPIVLRGDKLVSYSNTLLEAGSFKLSAAGLRVAVNALDAVVFISDGASPHGLRVETVPLDKLAVPVSGAPIDPNGLPYVVDDAFVDKDGNLLLFSKAQLSLFRWSPAERNYTGSFPLLGVPDHAAYSAENHCAYFAYASQTVRKMDLGAEAPVETPLFALPDRPSGLATAGTFIFASDPSGAWNSHYVLSPEGAMIQSKDWNYFSRVWAWDPVKRRMYFFRDDTSPNDLHYETIDSTGKITGAGETPYHGDFTATPPIRVSPDGAKVVIGSGVVFKSDGLTKTATLSSGFTDAVWWNQKLLTLHASGARTQIRRWDATTLAELATLPLISGTPVRLLALNAENLALITMEKGVPRIRILNANLEVIHTFISTPAAVEDMPFAWTPSFEWSTLGTGPVTVSAPVLPDWLAFSNGVLSGTPREIDSGDQVQRSKSHRVVVRAVDSLNQSEEREFFITALWRNDPPALPETTPRITANDRGESIQFDMGAVLTDADGKDVHQWWIEENSNTSIFADLQINGAGSLGIAFAPYVSGTSNVTIGVTDASGASARTSVEIHLPELPVPRVVLDTMPTLSRLTGLYEQRITVTNVAARAIAGFDLSISGLRTGVSLYNGTSTGEGGGSIAYHRPMKAGESVTLVLEYFASPRGTVPTPVISAAVTMPRSRILSQLSGTAPAFAVNRLVKQADGSVVIEFNAVPGKPYRIQYSADAASWKSCPVSIRAGGTKVQWIDRGPPWTDSPPSSSPRRFYRVQSLEE
jgi:fibronectin type 3 domain-containing protein